VHRNGAHRSMLLATSGSVPLLHVYLVFGFAVLLYTAFSGWLKSRMGISEPLYAIAVGIAFGPLGAGWIGVGDTATSRELALELARVTIGIQVLNAGIKVAQPFYAAHWRSLALMLTTVLLFMWVSSAAFVLAIFGELPFLYAVLIGAMLAPTDPVLAAAIVRGRQAEQQLPARLEDLIVSESAANDGLGLPFVYLPLLLLITPSAGEAIGMWFYDIWLYQVVLSFVMGAVWGAVAGRLLGVAVKHSLPDKESRLAFELVLALAVLGGVQVIGSDGFLGCFAAGIAFKWAKGGDADAHIESEVTTTDALDILLTMLFFAFLGAVLPWQAWAALGVGRLIALSLAVLLLTRMPAILVLRGLRLAPAVETYADALLVGWFGPVGVAAIYYAVDAGSQLAAAGDTARADVPFVICSFVVLAHVVTFSFTGPLVSWLYAWATVRHSETARAAPIEIERAAELPSRNATVTLGDESSLQQRRTAGGEGIELRAV
jgi:NhaP-type Na+/H+ or K+/H+ antiporter